LSVLGFPHIRAALAPAEASGRSRADVAMLVATRSDARLRDARFSALTSFLVAGDLLVINTSGTLPAAVPARLDGEDVRVHVSAVLAEGRWVIELRTADLRPFARPPIGAEVDLPGDRRLTLLAPYCGSDRLTEAEVELPEDTRAYLAQNGTAIRYDDGGPRWPLAAYQTVFALDSGSAEMPSAARPFSTDLVTELVARGVLIAPLTLDAGVSSLEHSEALYPERYRVPPQTARLVNAVHDWRGRVVAVGTSVVRALETVAGSDGRVNAAQGFTNLLITPERGLRAIDGLITGWHEPESSHLLMLEAAVGRPLLERSYARAAELGYRGHEFGDTHLILP
jgi:S-adenosylmethionine:tRNA ribosyltransferase-isomerase